MLYTSYSLRPTNHQITVLSNTDTGVVQRRKSITDDCLCLTWVGICQKQNFKDSEGTSNIFTIKAGIQVPKYCCHFILGIKTCFILPYQKEISTYQEEKKLHNLLMLNVTSLFFIAVYINMAAQQTLTGRKNGNSL